MNTLSAAINEAYNFLSDIGEVMSQNQFSRQFMRKSDRYMSWMRANEFQHEPSIGAVLAVYINLGEACNRLSANGNITAADRLETLMGMLWMAIKEAVLTSEPNRRPKPASPIQHDAQHEDTLIGERWSENI